MSSTDARSLAEMHVRVSRNMPRDLRTKISPRVIDDILKRAWANGWRDPEWIANHALGGTEHPGVRDAAALFVAQLTTAADMPCPDISERTPEPPAIADVMSSMHSGHQPASSPSTWADRIRKGLRR